MERPAYKTKLPCESRREIRRFATEDKAIVSIPEVVGIAIIAIQPPLAVIVAIHVEHVEIAVRVSYMHKAVHTTAP